MIRASSISMRQNPPETGTSAHRLPGWLAPALLSLGLALVIGLILWRGGAEVLGIILKMGWDFFWLLPLYAVTLFFAALSWRTLFSTPDIPPVNVITLAAWIGIAVGDLVPSGTVSGELAKARSLMEKGYPAHTVVPSLVVDKTIQSLALVLVSGAAVSFLPFLGASWRLVAAIALGWALLAGGVAGFIAVQHFGFFNGLAKGAIVATRGRGLSGISQHAHGLDERVRALYADHARILKAIAWRIGFRLGLALELWVIATLVEHPIDLLDAFMIEGLTAALRGAAFIVPGALGIQEGGYIALGAIIGLDPALMLALSLSKRVREFATGIPALLAWQAREGRLLWARLCKNIASRWTASR